MYWLRSGRTQWPEFQAPPRAGFRLAQDPPTMYRQVSVPNPRYTAACIHLVPSILENAVWQAAKPLATERGLSMKVSVVKETAPGERRVALVPEALGKLRAAGLEILVESGAGDGAWITDDSYAEAGASVVSRREALAADVVTMVGKPDQATVAGTHPGQVVIGMLGPLADPALVGSLAAAGVTAISLDMIPRTLPRAQPMDALSSQANIAGYKAAVVGAAEFGRFFPMLITAAGTARPARVLVLGTGVAGLQALGTARRLGAVVSAYDVRPEARAEAESVGATFIELTSVGPASGEGGYARALTEEERQAQQDELAAHIARHDVVITTAQVPGRRPPLLITEDALKAMAAGSVIVDMGASALGGNVAGSVPGETIVSENGVTIVGAGSLPSTMPAAASAMYARNIGALLLYLVKDGALALDPEDELQAGVIITRDGVVVHPALSPPAADEPPAADQPPAATDSAAHESAATEPGPAGSAEGTTRVPGTAS
jgi:H+-translocating NAD(P) transhydrogenase subunit alpha